MKKMILLMAALSFAALSFGALAAKEPSNAAASAPVENITVLKQDSGTNLSIMNATVATSPNVAVAQAVGFKSPKTGWKLEHVLIAATDGWNQTNKNLPAPLPFDVEIRDANLNLLYHFSSTQLPYFTQPQGIRMADIEVPAMPMNGDFFVCFYGYYFMGLMAELQNATGNSYYFSRPTHQLLGAGLSLGKNQTVPVNWIIRVAGT